MQQMEWTDASDPDRTAFESEGQRAGEEQQTEEG
jgi:hypothetical protein